VRALRIHGHGAPDVLSIDDVPEPKAPARGEALVRVLATSINHLDLWVRRGMPGVEIPLPRVLGCDGIGEVVALGEGVEGLRAGQHVVLAPGYSSGTSPEDAAGDDHLAPDYGIRGEHCDGFDQELVTLEQRFVLPLPGGVDPRHAAAVPLVFLTAWGMLVERARVEPGETVLVLGGASGVGSAAIQIARHAGARVLATGGSDEKRALARELGAEAAVDHRDPSWGKAIKELTDGRGADVVVEHVGPATWDTSMRVLARRGRLVTCGATTGPKVALMLPHLFIKNQSVLGSTMGPRRALATIFERIASGDYRPVVDSVVPMSQAASAHERLEKSDVLGKIVLVPAE